jgi:2-dehydro-3-deoxygluconokinase
MIKNANPKKIVLMGECMLELRQPEGAEPGDALSQSFAGDVYNTAVYLKRAFNQYDVSFMTALGHDTISKQMIDVFSKEQLNNSYVFTGGKSNPGAYLVETDSQGERSFLYWRESSSARQMMLFVDSKTIDSLTNADLFFFSGISIAILEPAHRLMFWNMLEELKKFGVKIAFDPNYRPSLWQDKEEAKAEFAKAYAHTNILLPSIDDFKQLYNIHGLTDLLEFCQPFDIQEMVIKNGEKSMYCQLGSNLMHLPTSPVKDVVDTTSAGDSFNGVYIGARMGGYELENAVKLASAAAGLVIQHPGAIVPSEIFKEFMQEKMKG